MKPVRIPDNLATLSESKLRALFERLDSESSAICSAMIAAGRGHETSWQTLAIPAESADALTLRFQDHSRRFGKAHAERVRRREWHGSLRPIRA